MQNHCTVVIAFLLGTAALRGAESPLSRIAFGSCAKENNPQPIWDAIIAQQPELFLFIGDNIYGDSREVEILKSKWDQLGAQPGYAKLRQTCRILATWDDHDYGWNDAGAEYPLKRESQQLFLDFFDEPKDSMRRKQEGIYDSKLFGPEGKRVQIILLDTRYHRSRLNKARNLNERGEGIGGPYVPNDNPHATMLGPAQWMWLEKQLRIPARLRIIASSIQVISNEHRWEKWGNLPRERERLLKMIRKTRANGVIIISGDRHTAEVSKLASGLAYPLYDVTSSSLNQRHRWRSELNPNRIGGMYYDENFGTIMIDWKPEDPVIRLQIRDMKGQVVIQVRHRLSDLQPRKSSPRKE
ncbi:MAG: phosphodiesterase [Verrucomicrobiales bacterium]|nr:phosphodiesterase [Verrucomicrobiales bacterium]|tara:strand:- start:12423 stop:13487 length:1065 start_codon:yes stop_codon:yes gene_type:complete